MSFFPGFYGQDNFCRKHHLAYGLIIDSQNLMFADVLYSCEIVVTSTRFPLKKG